MKPHGKNEPRKRANNSEIRVKLFIKVDDNGYGFKQLIYRFCV